MITPPINTLNMDEMETVVGSMKVAARDRLGFEVVYCT